VHFKLCRESKLTYTCNFWFLRPQFIIVMCSFLATDCGVCILHLQQHTRCTLRKVRFLSPSGCHDWDFPQSSHSLQAHTELVCSDRSGFFSRGLLLKIEETSRATVVLKVQEINRWFSKFYCCGTLLVITNFR
jgi:hypothetical protein